MLYEDAGEGWEFREGEFRLTRFAAVRDGRTVEISATQTGGKMARVDRKIVVRLLGGEAEVGGPGSERDGVRIEFR
jgi:hypothetical protein